MKNQSVRLSRRSFALIGGLVFLLSACSSGGNGSKPLPPVTVQTAMPVQKTFHTQVTAFGQLAADRRKALSLSMPQAGQVIATDVIAGQRVKHGEPLLKLKTNPTSRKAYLQAKNGVKVARQNLAHVQRLQAGRLATNAQVDAALKALADAKVALAAQAKLGGAKSTAILKAPTDGVVTALQVQPGQRLTAGVPLIAFTPDGALAAQLGVDPAAAAGIHTGMPVSIQPVYGVKGADPLAGTVAVVGNAVNPKTHLVDVVATLAAPTQIAAGTALAATIDTSRFRAWAVPRDALESDSKGSYVFQIEHGKAKRVDVKVLAPRGSPIGVAGAIDPKAPVITLGSYEVSAGRAVRAAKPAGARAKGSAAR
jgi:RND family efflux transporter MFP subunit